MLRRAFLTGTALLLAERALALNGPRRALLRGSGNLVPSWVLAGATLDLDFANARYYGDTLANLLSCSRASTGYVTNADGTLTSCAANALRIGVGTGLLVEEARTNLALSSQNFTAAAPWAGTGSNQTTAITATVAPDGSTFFYKITDTSTSSYRSQDVTTAAAVYTYSIFAKRFDNDFVYFGVFNGSDKGAWFNLATGAVGSATGSAIGRITALSSGVYRLEVTFTATAGATSITFPFTATADASFTRVSGASNLAWGAQLELGSFATSYIPTTTVAVARAADVVTGTGALATLAAGSATSYFAQTGVLKSLVNTRILGGNGARSALFVGGANLVAIYNGVTLTPMTFSGNSFTAGGAKVASSYDGSGRSVVGNNGTVSTDAVGSAQPVSTLYVGSDGGTGQFCNGYIQRLAAWNSRLPDATLKGLTV